MESSRPVGFRPPLTSVLPVAVVLLGVGVLLQSEGSVALAMFLVAILAALRLRQLLVLHDDHIEVTVLRRRRIPWTEVEGFDPATGMRGGTRIQTADGIVHAVAPCSWWGGPAKEADIETLRRMRAARVRRR